MCGYRACILVGLPTLLFLLVFPGSFWSGRMWRSYYIPVVLHISCDVVGFLCLGVLLSGTFQLSEWRGVDYVCKLGVNGRWMTHVHIHCFWLAVSECKMYTRHRGGHRSPVHIGRVVSGTWLSQLLLTKMFLQCFIVAKLWFSTVQLPSAQTQSCWGQLTGVSGGSCPWHAWDPETGQSTPSPVCSGVPCLLSEPLLVAVVHRTCLRPKPSGILLPIGWIDTILFEPSRPLIWPASSPKRRLRSH